MPNSIDYLKSEAWESMLQEVLYRANVGMQIADTKYEGSFDGADTVHIPYMSKISVLPLASSYSDVTLQNLSTGEDTMTLSDLQHFAVTLSEVDIKEMKISPETQFLKDGAQAFLEAYDDSIMAHYTDAGLTIKDGDMAVATNGGGTNSITLTTGAQVYQVIVRVSQKLNTNNVPQADRFIILSPVEQALLNLDSTYLVRSTTMGDNIVTGGYMGRINDVKVFYSNALVTAASKKHVLAGAGTPVFFAANIKPKVVIQTPQNTDGFYYVWKAQTKFDTKVTTASARRLIDVQITA